MWWRTRDLLSHLLQWSDSLQNQGVSQISPVFKILMVDPLKSHMQKPENLGDGDSVYLYYRHFIP